MHARTPPRRIQEATRGDGYVEDHAQVSAIVTALRGAPTPAAAREEMRCAAAMLEPHMAEEEAADGVFAWLAALDPKQLQAGSSEIRNWLIAVEAVKELDLEWVEYVPGYRSPALTGTGLCFAAWRTLP